MRGLLILAEGGVFRISKGNYKAMLSDVRDGKGLDIEKHKGIYVGAITGGELTDINARQAQDLLDQIVEKKFSTVEEIT